MTVAVITSIIITALFLYIVIGTLATKLLANRTYIHQNDQLGLIVAAPLTVIALVVVSAFDLGNWVANKITKAND